MKHLKFIIIPLLSLILASCGSNLPAKSSLEAGEGIFAVAKSMKSEITFQSGWKTDLQVTDANGKVMDDLIRLHPVNGRQFLFVKNFSAGDYAVTGLRRVGAGENAVGSSAPMTILERGIPFTIVEGEITVFPIVFAVFNEAVVGDSNRGFSRLETNPLVGEELEEFKAVMAKVNKNNEWKVNWPK